jgi:ribonucleoside-diphosphate reductase alpha chain
MAKKDTKEEDQPSLAAHTAETPEMAVAIAAENLVPRGAVRRDLPQVRNSKTFKFTIDNVRCYMTVGEYEDGTPGELFVSIAKMGSTLRGVMDSFAVSVSYGLQFGVPLKNYVRNFTNTSFAPAGVTDDPDIRTASSIIDYIFKRLGKTYLSFDDQLEVGLAALEDMPEGQASLLDDTADVSQAEQVIAIEAPVAQETTAPAVTASASTSSPAPEPVKAAGTARKDDSAPLCYNCGNTTQRSGTCYVCTSCGSTTGCS